MGLNQGWEFSSGRRFESVQLPHVWGREIDVRWEGPGLYRRRLDVPSEGGHLLFHGVSYAATVRIEGEFVAEHRGIWDAFTVDLSPWAGRQVTLEVEVIKNGGTTYPVNEVAAGFLPYVYHTFGGIFREVELLSQPPRPTPPNPPPVEVRERQIWVDGKPLFLRGVLSWGWYPEIGSPHPPQEVIRDELDRIERAGFNLVKFCLWLPPHAALEEMSRRGLWAWIELPLWKPTGSPERLAEMADELERIAAQYARHRCVLAWTIGCELDRTTSAATRCELVERIRRATRSQLVGDSSGGSEMYDGDPREFGAFDDFHPYCDLPLYPLVLDSLLPQARTPRPIFLGEFNDYDMARHLPALQSDMPFWASTDPALNDPGVRWQVDFPAILASPLPDLDYDALVRSSRSKSNFIRQFVHDEVRLRPEIGGLVITGLRDTPISTSGVLDDYGREKGLNLSLDPDRLILMRRRRPPWIRGGNRPGWVDPLNVFPGACLWPVAVAREQGISGTLTVEGLDAELEASLTAIEPLRVSEVGRVFWMANEPGEETLTLRFDQIERSWPIWTVAPLTPEELSGWRKHDPLSLLDDLEITGPDLIATVWDDAVERHVRSGGRALVLQTTGGIAGPFWRECAFLFGPAMAAWEDRWERLVSIGGDQSLEIEWLAKLGEVEVAMERIDTRTYARHPLVARVRLGRGTVIFTTLRPFGGLGIQPPSLTYNPAGCQLLRELMRWSETNGEARL